MSDTDTQSDVQLKSNFCTVCSVLFHTLEMSLLQCLLATTSLYADGLGRDFDDQFFSVWIIHLSLVGTINE